MTSPARMPRKTTPRRPTRERVVLQVDSDADGTRTISLNGKKIPVLGLTGTVQSNFTHSGRLLVKVGVIVDDLVTTTTEKKG